MSQLCQSRLGASAALRVTQHARCHDPCQVAQDAVLATFERRVEKRVDPLVEELLGEVTQLRTRLDDEEAVSEAVAGNSVLRERRRARRLRLIDGVLIQLGGGAPPQLG